MIRTNHRLAFLNSIRDSADLDDTLPADLWGRFATRRADVIVRPQAMDDAPSSLSEPGPATDAFPAAGSIAFTGFNADDPDSLAFAVLEDIAAGSVITFDDNEWNGTAFNTGEGTLTLTLTTAVAAGTIVRIDSSNTATPTTSHGTIARSGSFDLSGTTESVYAYTGTAAAPTFLAALGISGFTGATTTGLLTNTGLTLGTHAIDIGVIDAGADIAAYDGLRTGQTSFTDYAAIINNTANWVTQDAAGSQAGDGTNPDTPFSAVSFVIAGGAGALAIDDVTLAEGDTGTTAFSFTVTRSGGSTGVVGATWTLTAPGGAGNADAGDFDALQSFTGTVSFADGDTSETITILVQGDLVNEDDEDFTVELSLPTGGATIGDDTGEGTITNDDAAPVPGELSIGDVTMNEGNAGTTSFTFTVLRTGGDDGAVSATWTLDAPGGANLADSADFAGAQPTSGTVSFADGQTSQTITILVQGDVSVETSETFLVTLSAPTGGATLGNSNGTGTILNDDAVALPSASIGDVSVAESDDGVSYLVFTVTLSSPATGPVSFDFATSNGTATAGSDYVAHSGQVAFATGETTQTISIPIIGDANPEVAETLVVTLSNPIGDATINDGTATGTITNDDGSGYYSLAGGSFTQDWTNIGQITANDNWSGVPFVIGYRGDDLTTATGTDARTITGTSAVVDVNANQTDPSTFNTGGVTEFHLANPVVGLTGSGTADAPYLALYMDASGRSDVRVQANLRDIDGSIDDAAQQIAVQYRTSASGPWLNAPGGYFADVTTANSATQVTAVDITLPADANGAATLEIRFLTTNAAGNDEYVGIDDIVISSVESAPILSIGNSAIFEGDFGSSAITFTVTRSGTTTGTVTADYTVNFPGGINSTSIDDFEVGQVFTGQVSFADGQTSATITFNVDGDIGPEADENFTVTLSNPVGGIIGDGVATGTIINDDGPPPLVTINDVTVTEGDAGTSLMTFTVTRTGGTGAFDVSYATQDITASAGSDYVATSGTLNFADGQMSQTISVAINGDTLSEVSETLRVVLSNATNFALLADSTGVGTIAGDDPIFIHDIQGTSYFSPILAAEGIGTFNTASAGFVTVRAVVTAVDNVGNRQGYYLTEEITDWDGNSYTSEGIFVMTRNDAGAGSEVSGVTAGDLVQLSAQVMEYQAFNTMPRTMLVNSTGLQIISTGNPLPTVTLTGIPNEVLTAVTPDLLDSTGNTFDASLYALSYFETVEGMLVTVPNMVVADGFVSTSGGDPFLQAYSLDSANADQINSRGGYTISGDPPNSPPDTAGTGDDTNHGGQHLHDGDVNPDIIELDFTDFATEAPPGLLETATMGDLLGDVTGIIDFDFTDRKLFVTSMEPGGFVNSGNPVQETTALGGGDGRSLTVATFNVENLDPGDGAARFTALANAIANNLNAPDIICIEEMQDNNGAAGGGTDASTSWQMLVDALNLATGSNYQWVDQDPNGSEGGEPGGNIRVGFLYNTDRVQLGDLDANATIAERRQYTDRIGDGVRDAGDLIAFSDDMLGAEISASDWAGTRRSLLGEFNFNGNSVYVTANHWPAKGGSGEFWQFDQDLENGDPDNSGWAQRNQVAQDVYAVLNLIEGTAPEAGIVAGGDFNDFYFYRPLEAVTGYVHADGTARVGGARFENLTLTLPEAERYTYTFDGRSQAIDHIIVNGLLGDVATYDVVHLNTGYNSNGTGVDANPSLSDHDPGLASFDYRNFDEVLNGTAGNDFIDGFGGDDTISTGLGDDMIVGGAGADTMSGGDDDDTYHVDDAGDVVIELAGEGNDTIFTSINYQLGASQFVEILAASVSAGTTPLNLTGNGQANEIYGNAGANVLHGGGGLDMLAGLGGNDVFYTDVAGTVVVEAAGGGTDVLYTSVSYVLGAADVETLSTSSHAATTSVNLTGNGIAQTIVGNAGANILHGGGGADVLIGLAGNDVYYTDFATMLAFESIGNGFDSLYTSVSYTLSSSSEIELLSTNLHIGTAAINLTGNSFNQVLYGNAGANVLDGKFGVDTLVGFGGADQFTFSSGFNSQNIDYIRDMQTGIDKIALDDAIFTGLGLGALSADAFRTGTAAQDSSDRIIYNASNGNLYYDSDGNGSTAAILFANLQNLASLSASDFVVI